MLRKPCSMYELEQHGRKIYVKCGYDKSLRKDCKRERCPHFRPTLLFKMSRKFGKEI